MPTQKVFSKSQSRSNLKWYIAYNGLSTELESSNSVVKWTDTVDYGDNIRNWRESLLAGNDTTTGLTVSGRTLSIRRGRLVAVNRSPTGLPTGAKTWIQSGDFNISTAFSSSNPTSISDASANARALGKFVNRAREVNTTFQGGVFLGELAQTIHGIRHPAKGLRELVDTYRHKAVKLRSAEGFRVLRHPFERNLADLWLESSFHWKPLIHDIQDGARASAQLVEKVEKRPTSVPVRGVATVVSNSQESVPALFVEGGFRYLLCETLYDSCTAVYRGAIRVMDLTTPAGQAALLGFDPASFAPTAWELVPYSFLVDYFTNIGEVITGLSFPRAGVKWSNRTIIREVVAERTVSTDGSLYSGQTVHLSSFSAPQVVASKRHISRASYNGTYVPKLNLEVPDLGSLRWLNIAALVTAQASDKRFRWL
jgi:hypothetical protein